MLRRYSLASLLAVLILTACGGAETEREFRRFPTSVYSSQINPVSEDELYRFFAVAFGAAPGALYMSQLREAAAAGLDLRTIVNIFTTKSQFLERYPASLSSQAFAERLVRDIVRGSATEAAQQMAITDVREALAQGLSRGDVIYAIVNNLASKPSDDPYWAGTARLLNNKIIYARHFTDSMQSSSTDLPSLQRVLTWLNRDSSVQGDLTAAIQEALKPTHLVFPAPTMLPDLKDKFTKLCGNHVEWHIQTGVALNLSGHLDGRKDIMLSLWCAGVQAPGVSNTTPVKNILVALLQNPDGSFRDGTFELFGTNEPDIGGIPHYAAVGDYNGDGLSDVVYSVSREDGRDLSIDHDLNGAKPAFVTSGSGGRYRIERLGTPEWGYAAMNIDNELGGQDVLVAGEVYDVWRYTSSDWTKIANYSTWATPRTHFFRRTAPGLPSTMAIVGENSGKQLSLYKRAGGGQQWNMTDSYSLAIANPERAVFVAWNGQVGEQTITRFNGKDYTAVYFDAVCELRMQPSMEPITVASFTGLEIVGGYQGQVINEGVNTQSMSTLMAFTVNGGKLKPFTLNISGEVTARFAMFGSGLRCRDINGDGADDIEVVTVGGEHGGEQDPPMVYLNQGQGNFKRMSRSTFPKFGTLLESAAMLYEDFDGDGVRDLFFFSASTSAGKNRPMSFPLYKGLRPLQASD